MFVDRRRRDDPFLEWKVRLFSVAAVLVLVGLYLDNRWLTGLAIALLVVAMLLRFLPGGSAHGVTSEDEDGAGAAAGEDDDGADAPAEGAAT